MWTDRQSANPSNATFSFRPLAHWLAPAIVIILVLFAASRVNPQVTAEVGESAGAGIAVTDMSFLADEDVDVSVQSTDDVFAAGGTIKVDDTSADHLVVAGGEISVKDVKIHDLIAAGGELNLTSAQVEDDIVVAGGDVRVQPDFAIGGSAVLAGGNVRIEAPVAVDLRTSAGTVYVNSAIGGNARLVGEEVTLGPRARIGGDLLYRTDNLVIEPGATITGKRIVLPADEGSSFERWGRGLGGTFAALALAIVVGFAVLVIAVAVAVPSLMRSSAEQIRAQPLRSLGIGFLIAIGTPFVIVLLLMTGIGVPLALLLVALCIAITPVAVAATAFLIGKESRGILTKQTDQIASISGRMLWPALGALVITVLGLVPLLGILVWLLAILVGLGAVASRGGRALATNA